MPHARTRGSYSSLSLVIDVMLSVVIITVSTGAMEFVQKQWEANDDPNLRSFAWSNERLIALRQRYEELLRQLKQLPSLDQLPEVDLQALEEARQRLQKELAALREEIARIEAGLQETQGKDSQRDQKRQRLVEELARLRQQISDLEAQLEKLRYDREQIEKLKQKLAELLEQLEQAKKRYEDIQNKIAEAIAEQVKEGFRIEVHPRFRPVPGTRLKLMVIQKMRVTPVCQPYYEIRTESRTVPTLSGTISGDVTLYRLRQYGPAAADALKPASEVMQWIDKLDPKRQYVVLLVDRHSFDVCRAVRAELHKRKIRCGWEPHEDVQQFATGPARLVSDGSQLGVQ